MNRIDGKKAFRVRVSAGTGAILSASRRAVRRTVMRLRDAFTHAMPEMRAVRRIAGPGFFPRPQN